MDEKIILSPTEETFNRFSNVIDLMNKLHEELERLEELGVSFCGVRVAVGLKKVHVHLGIETLANAFKRACEVIDSGIPQWRVQKQFKHKDIKIFQLEREVSVNAGQSEKDCGIEETDGRDGHTAQGVETGV